MISYIKVSDLINGIVNSNTGRDDIDDGNDVTVTAVGKDNDCWQ